MEQQLPASRLGTREHWDRVYEREVDVWRSTDGEEEGEVWFGDSAVNAMIRWVKAHRPLAADESSPTVLDVGCGNGHLLIALHEELDFPPHLLYGIDYSQPGIAHAQAVTAGHDIEGIRYEAIDWLDPAEFEQRFEGKTFDLLLDKGTYDAISLMPVEADEAHPILRYPALTAQRLPKGGIFLITSCNWTEDELKARFLGADVGFALHSKVEKPKFSFGGQTGSTTVTLAFEKR